MTNSIYNIVLTISLALRNILLGVPCLNGQRFNTLFKIQYFEEWEEKAFVMSVLLLGLGSTTFA
jgi:hypothetical protein